MKLNRVYTTQNSPENCVVSDVSHYIRTEVSENVWSRQVFDVKYRLRIVMKDLIPKNE